MKAQGLGKTSKQNAMGEGRFYLEMWRQRASAGGGEAGSREGEPAALQKHHTVAKQFLFFILNYPFKK